MTDKKRNILLLLAFLATTLLTLVPFFHVGFTNGDDFEYYNTASKSFLDQWHLAKEYSRYAGRFYFLFTKFFYYVPYLVDSFVYTKIVQFTSLILCYIIFAYVVYKLFKSKTIALITYLFLILDTVVTSNNFIPTIAYPFFFSFSLIIFELGILLYINYKDNGGYWRVLLSSLLFFASFLFYENYILFAFVFVLVIGIKYISNDGISKTIKCGEFWKTTLLYISVTFVYLFIYFGYRHFFVDNSLSADNYYSGTQFSFEKFSVAGFFKVLVSCTRAALPWEAYVDNQVLLSDCSTLTEGHKDNLFYVLSHAPIIVWLNAIIEAGLLWFITRKNDSASISRKTFIISVVSCVLIAFFSHTLIGIGEKYNLEWSQWMQGYVTTFFAIFAMMLAFALLLVLMLNLCRNTIVCIVVRLFWCAALACVSVVSGYTSHTLSRGWENSQNQLRVIELIANDGYLKNLPMDALIFTGEMRNMSYFSNEICKETSNIEDYIDRVSGRSFKYESDIEAFANADSNVSRYYIHSVESKKGDGLLLSLSKIDIVSVADGKAFAATNTDVFYYSCQNPARLKYKSSGSWKTVEQGFEKTSNGKVYHLKIQDEEIDPRMMAVGDANNKSSY